MNIDGAGNLCLWCMEEMGENSHCPHCGHDERELQCAEQAIAAGTIIGGHYLLGRTLGQGGFGITYLAYDLDLHIKRAIKEYFPQGLVIRVGNSVKVSRQSVSEIYQKGVDSFYREAQSIARFGGHPNVVQVHAFFRENDTAYFVMDYVDGTSFRRYLESRGGRISWQEALRIIKPIGEALTALHESHLLHRDVKPDNIFLTRAGIPKLLDFGAARYETSECTHSSAAVLTPGYAPAEQYGSISRQGPFTDVYALSATFYRAVSGTVPIPAPDRMETDTLLPLNKVDEQVPVSISAAISHGMGVRREKRTQTTAELLKELELPVKPKSAKWLLPVILAVLAVILAGELWLVNQSRTDSAGKYDSIVVNTQNALSITQTAFEIVQAGVLSISTETAVPSLNAAEESYQPTAVPTATNTAEPTAAPAAINTEPPTAVPTATNTAEPTAVPTATNTAEPTAVPTATNTAEPTAVPTEEISQAVITDGILNAQVGEHIRFGHYEQDNETENGKEAIEWRVLAREGDHLLLLSEYALDAKPYNTADEGCSWEDSSLRGWLNGTFYRNAFSEKERKQIMETTVKADNGKGTDTLDRIFLLSGEETESFFPVKKDRSCSVTAYAAANNARSSGGYHNQENEAVGWWWLRTPFYDNDSYALYVGPSGSISVSGVNNGYGSVRPALRLKLEANENELTEANADIPAMRERPVIAEGGCYIYRNADERSDKLGWLKDGVKITQTLEAQTVQGKQWEKILTESGTEGWVYSKNIGTYKTKIAVKDVQPGDFIDYGYYEQDNNFGNSEEIISWRVLARDGNRLLLLSEYGLDAKPFHTEKEDQTWETCSLRSWLNGAFYENAFTPEEQARIVLTEVKAEINPDYGTGIGNDTQDKIFLLSIPEAEQYFENNEDRKCQVTDYAKANGAYQWWWLRTSGSYRQITAYVGAGGAVNTRGYFVNYYNGTVRPAFWLNL